MAAQSDRLPQITAALVIEAVGLEVFRDQFGMQQCLVRGIGPRRKKLGLIADIPGFLIGPEEMARDGARQILAGLCRVCPFASCRMKTWDMGLPALLDAGGEMPPLDPGQRLKP